MSFQGRLLEVGTGEVRATGEVLSRVVHTFERVPEGVIDAEVRFADGRTEVLSATPEHPVYAPEAGKYVSLRHLEVGARLHTLGGGTAVLVGKTWRQGGVEVFNLEVDGGHNFFAAGVLTHNAKKDCGSYTVFFENGCRYHGKCQLDRAWKSARRLQGQGDGVWRVSWSSAADSRAGYLQEWARMLADPAWQTLCNGKRYNKIRQPGGGRTQRLSDFEWPTVD